MARECPFCGNRRVIVDTIKNAEGKAILYRNACAICKASTRWSPTEEEAAKAWDARAAPPVEPAPEASAAAAPQPPPEASVKAAPKPAGEGTKRKDSFINRDLFLYRGDVYARNPQTQLCYRDHGGEGYKRIRKADYLLAYAELGKKAEKEKNRGKWKK
jgi:Lar family restriction alleviation protein